MNGISALIIGIVSIVFHLSYCAKQYFDLVWIKNPYCALHLLVSFIRLKMCVYLEKLPLQNPLFRCRRDNIF